jgi:hypothetical protein
VFQSQHTNPVTSNAVRPLNQVPARITLKTVNDELARLGYDARLAKGSGYFYFWTGEAADWLDRTVKAPVLNALTLEQWIQEFRRLQKLNRDILRKPSVLKTPTSKGA